MYAGRNFSSAAPDEVEDYTLDFARDIPRDAVLVSASWTCTVVKGADADAASRLQGAPSVSGTKTTHRVSGLLSGVKYKLRALAVTDDGLHVELYSLVSGGT